MIGYVPFWFDGYTEWLVAIAVLVAMTCAIPGSFLLVRRESMMGDAISHAVLPGIAIGFLISGSRNREWMFLGAAISGIATAILAQSLRVIGRVERGAALGIVFTTLFALGLVLIVQSADHVDLDPSCVLYGQIELAPLDTVTLAGYEIPRALPILGAVFLIVLLTTLFLWKELLITSFDSEIAYSQGIPPQWIHQILMVLVAVTCVAAFESVGSILVVALLVAPAASARLLTDRLVTLVPLSAILGALAAMTGTLAALTLPGQFETEIEDVNIAGSIAIVCGLMVILAAIGSPRRGLVVRYLNRIRLQLRIAVEDLIGALYRIEIEKRTPETPIKAQLLQMGALRSPGMKTNFWLGLARWHARRRGLLTSSEPSNLTPAGLQFGAQLVRTHRLWESYLADHTALPANHLHDTAMDLEHFTAPALSKALEEIAPTDPVDPHGRAIPDPTQPPLPDAEPPPPDR